MTCLDGITDSVDIRLSKFWEIVKDREELDVTEQLNDKDEK